MDAHISITGNVGGDVDFRSSTIPIASFRLASTPRIKREGGWTDGATTWISVSCFRGLAEHVASSVRKGDPLIVTGRLRTSVWSKEGVEHERLVLEATSVGHDLTWGTSAFQRAARTTGGAPSAVEDSAEGSEVDEESAEQLEAGVAA